MTSQKVANNPLGSYPVIVDRNAAGEERQAVGIDFGTVSGGVLTESKLSTTNPLPVAVYSGLVPQIYDYISLGYTGSNLTSVIYKTGGSGGTTVATLTLAYTGSQLDTVTRT